MRIQLTRRLRRSDEGAIAVIVALLSTLLIVMAALAADFGNAYAVKRQLSVAADASALDAARAVATAKSGGVPLLGGGRGCATWTPAQKATAQSVAQTAATTTNSNNDLSGDSTIDAVTVTCVGDSRVEVEVSNTRSLPTFFGGLAGAAGYTPARSATAAVIPRLAVGGLRPYAACNTVVDAAAAAPGSTFVMDLDNKIGICNTTKNGDWGVVDFDGGSNPLGDISDWTTNGYPNPITAPDPNLPGDPGMPGPGKIDGPLSSIVDQIVLFPVVTGYTAPSKGGSNAKFNLVGFVGARVCGYRLNNKLDIGLCYDSVKAAPYNTAKVNFIQFQYVDYTTSYSGGGATCSFTDPKCKFAILGAQLYK